MERVDKLLELMEKEYGAKPMIYTSEKLYTTHFNVKKYKPYHFFIANYKREPAVAYTLWQYTQHGKQKGIAGFVDFSRFNKKYDVEDIKISTKDTTSAQQVSKATEKKIGTKTVKKQVPQKQPVKKKSAYKPQSVTTASKQRRK